MCSTTRIRDFSSSKICKHISYRKYIPIAEALSDTITTSFLGDLAIP
jgi:hypothetical protein